MPELKPTSYPDWATDDVILPVAGTNNKIEPRTIMQTQGADKGNFFGAEEANWILNNNGLWARYLDQEVEALNDTNLREYDTVADMVADDLLATGDYVRTLGYHTFGDTGGAIYKVSTAAGTVDGMTLIALDNGLRAEFVYVANTYSPIQFGAVGNGVADDSVPMQKLADLLEDNPAVTNLQGGVVAELHGRVFNVSFTPQNKLTIKNGTLRQVSNGSNIIEHVEGSAKSDGWDLLRLENVIIDGANKGSGTVTVEDGVDSYTLEDTNMGIYLDVNNTSTSKLYKLVIEGCTFKGIHNSMLCYINTVDSLVKESMYISNTTFNGEPPVVTTESVNIIVDTAGVVRDNVIFSSCLFSVTNGLLLNNDTKCVFSNVCNLSITTASVNSATFYGKCNISLLDSKMFNTGSGKLTRNAYNLIISNSEIEGGLAINNSYIGQHECNLRLSDTKFDNLEMFREGTPTSGTRPPVEILISDCTHDSESNTGLYINPTDNSSSETITGGAKDNIRVTGNRAKGVIAVNLEQEAFIVFNANHIENVFGTNYGIKIDGLPTQLACNGNIAHGTDALIETNQPNVDTTSYYAIAGNWIDATNVLESTTDATSLPKNYNN
jgi:hypothetical protein